jgi:hypothetical protein
MCGDDYVNKMPAIGESFLLNSLFKCLNQNGILLFSKAIDITLHTKHSLSFSSAIRNPSIITGGNLIDGNKNANNVKHDSKKNSILHGTSNAISKIITAVSEKPIQINNNNDDDDTIEEENDDDTIEDSDLLQEKQKTNIVRKNNKKIAKNNDDADDSGEETVRDDSMFEDKEKNIDKEEKNIKKEKKEKKKSKTMEEIYEVNSVILLHHIFY